MNMLSDRTRGNVRCMVSVCLWLCAHENPLGVPVFLYFVMLYIEAVSTLISKKTNAGVILKLVSEV